MDELQLATVFEGVTAATVIFAAFMALRYWIQGSPERSRVRNETKVLDISEMDKRLADYAQQVKDFRTEVHSLREDLQKALAEQLTSDKLSDQRSNWINDMLFIIELLITELERIDPKSAIVKQAKMMLKRIKAQGTDPLKSESLNIAETAVRDAKQTVRSAEHTVVEITADEAVIKAAEVKIVDEKKGGK